MTERSLAIPEQAERAMAGLERLFSDQAHAYRRDGHVTADRAAYHEAGHAVVGLAQGRLIERLSIDPAESDGHPGVCVSRWPAPRAKPATRVEALERCRELATFGLAGFAAEELAGVSRGGHEDWTLTRAMLRAGIVRRDGDVGASYLTGAQFVRGRANRAAYVERAFARSATILRARWPLVVAIAEALEAQRSIGADELQRITAARESA